MEERPGLARRGSRSEASSQTGASHRAGPVPDGSGTKAEDIHAVSRIGQESRRRRGLARAHQRARAGGAGKVFRRRLFRPRDGRQGGVRLSHRMRRPSRFRHHAARRRDGGRCLSQRRSGGGASRSGCAATSAGSRTTMPPAATMAARRTRAGNRRAELRHRRAGAGERGRGHRLQSGHHRRGDHGAEAAVGQRGGDGAGHDRRAGRGVPPRRPRPRQPGLSPRGRPYRLDRPARRCCPTAIDGSRGRSLWSAAFHPASAELQTASRPVPCRPPISSRRTRSSRR